MLIVESSFVSLADVGSRFYPYLPARLILRYRYDTAARLTGVKSPVLVVHSRDDETMPYGQALRLFEIASEPKLLLTISGSHNEGFLSSGAVYLGGLDDFISEHLVEPP